MTKALVTGGAGAIGSNIVRELMARGWDVTVLDDLSSGHRGLLPEGVRFVHGKVQDHEALNCAFQPAPEYVIHLAALFANQNSVDNPSEDLIVGGMGTLNVLEKSRECRVSKVLYTSSSCVYGNKEFMTESEEIFAPDTPYAITKILGERYCRFWARHHGLDVVMVRLFNCYGPGEYPGKYRNVIPNFFSLAMKGQPLPITGTGEEMRDFTFVEDTVRGVLGALMAETQPGDVFNIASGKGTRILDLANLVNEIAGNKAGVQFHPRRGWDHVMTRIGDIQKAQQEWGFQPSAELREGLTKTYAWLKSIDAP